MKSKEILMTFRYILKLRFFDLTETRQENVVAFPKDMFQNLETRMVGGD